LLIREESGTAGVAAAAGAAAASAPGTSVAASNESSSLNSCNGGGPADSSSRYSITCHPHVPAVILEGSGPYAVDLSTGAQG
jgi:hypothetical protein